MAAAAVPAERVKWEKIKTPLGWTVGFHSPDGKWHPESDWEIKDEWDAVERVRILNS